MSEEEALKILNQIEHFDDLCECVFKKEHTCIGCREEALKIILNNYQELQQRVYKAIEYITSYESADTLMSYENKENNKGLDEKTMIEMDRRYLIIQGKLLEILEDKE